MDRGESVSERKSLPGSVRERDLRVSDAEREHVAQLLQRAVGLGMLSLGEFTERMDTTLVAKTRGELNAVLIDLPGMRLAQEPVATPQSATAPRRSATHSASPADPTHSVAEEDLVRGRFSAVTRRGPWRIAPLLRVNSMFSSVTLDFTEALASTQVVEIRVDDAFSALTLILPAEATADLSGLELTGATITNKVHTGRQLGNLHLVVRGRVRCGSVTAKHPLLTQWRKRVGF